MVGPRQPPAAHQFRKGQSGNPKGRPRTRLEKAPSAFDVVIDRTLTIVQGGQPREVTVDEALQHKTYQDALAGNRTARRAVLKMIAKREKALAARKPRRHTPIEVRVEATDPDNANAALLLLGIAGHDHRYQGCDAKYERLLLAPWAVQAALGRRGSGKLTARDISEIQRCTRDADTLRWPVGRDA